MQRDHNNCVTHFPILIPCSVEKQQGEATFDVFQGPVREVTDKDFDRKFLSRMQVDECLHFAGIVGLMQGIQNRDRVAIAKFREKLSAARAMSAARAKEARRAAQLGEESTEMGRLMAPYLGLEPGQGPKEAEEILSGHRLPPRIAKDDAKVLSWELSRNLCFFVRLVLWWTGTRFTPALFCNDPKFAPYVYVLTRNWSVCPHCGHFFEQRRADQNYCKVAHREAHRMARWRALKAAKLKEKGDRHVTRKTR
jgi:hypothetical protein